MHRDIKPQNILLTRYEEQGHTLILLTRSTDPITLKIADFGFAKMVETQSLAETFCGSPLYMVSAA